MYHSDMHGLQVCMASFAAYTIFNLMVGAKNQIQWKSFWTGGL